MPDVSVTAVIWFMAIFGATMLAWFLIASIRTIRRIRRRGAMKWRREPERGRRPETAPERVPPPPPPPPAGRPSGRIIAYVHQAPDDKVTVFDPAEIWIVREGTDG